LQRMLVRLVKLTAEAACPYRCCDELSMIVSSSFGPAPAPILLHAGWEPTASSGPTTIADSWANPPACEPDRLGVPQAPLAVPRKSRSIPLGLRASPAVAGRPQTLRAPPHWRTGDCLGKRPRRSHWASRMLSRQRWPIRRNPPCEGGQTT